MPRQWTPEQRERQRLRCLENRPWKKSTGPKTEAGKNKSKYNALKHCQRIAYIRDMEHILAGYRRLYRQFLARKKQGSSAR